MHWVALRSKPLSYHLDKLREGYAFLENDKGKRIALSPVQRRLIGALSRLVNLPTFLRRWSLGKAAVRAAPGAPRMANGYVKISAVPGYEEIVELCLAQTGIYSEYKNEGHAALLRRGIDPVAYEREVAKTHDDPLKHIPSHYDPAVLAKMLEFALQPQLVASASRYLGLLPVVASVRILFSPNEQGDLAFAQRFHIDPEGARQAKGFMAVWHVGPEQSPLTFVPADLSREMLRAADDTYRAKRVPDKVIDRIAPRSTWVEHVGAPGDAVIVDTSNCFHFGSRPNKKKRLLFYFVYMDPLASCFPVLGQTNRDGRWKSYKGSPSPFADYLLGRRL